MTVSCPDCRSVFRVDPAKVPATGVRARCSVCGGVIAISAGTLPVSVTPASLGAVGSALPTRPNHPTPQRPYTPIAVPSPTPTARPLISRPTPPMSAPPVSAPPMSAQPESAPTADEPALGAAAAPHATSPGMAPAMPSPATASPAMATPSVSAPPVPPPTAMPATTPVFVSAVTETPNYPAEADVGERPAVAADRSVMSPMGRPTPISMSGVSTPDQGHTRPSIAATTATLTPRRSINPFLNADPSQRARRLARALVSDLVAYHPQKREEGMREGTLRQLFREDIKKSYEEYVEQVGRDTAEGSPHFQEALNEILAGGHRLF